ncbi:MAG: phosphotransferase family protein [Pseudomonadota bacterium]
MSMHEDVENPLNAIAGSLAPGAQGIRNLKRLSSGASQETWAFEVVVGDSFIPLILRRAPGGSSAARSEAAIGLSGEADLIDRARQNGVPAPQVLHICKPEDQLGEAFIMARIEGETLARKILRDDPYAHARTVLSKQCGRALAGIHAIAVTDLPMLESSFGLDQLSRYEEIYRSFDVPRPIFEFAIKWLRDHAPEAIGPVLVHGDFRLGNLMVDHAGLAAVLDWELAHIGDPREDLAWICINSWRFGVSDNRVGGFGKLDALLDAYADAGGTEISISDIDWFEMLGSLKWGVMCMIMYEAFRSGADPSVERAAIGRRVSETEIDIINLLERV